MRRALLLVAAFAALACLAAAGAPLLTGQARADDAYPRTFTTTDDAGAARAVELAKDRIHSLQIVANLRAAPPEQPVVILLGGSSAREATVDDDDWADQILGLGGPHVLAYNLGCRHDTFEIDREIAKRLPRDMPGIVFIGINLGRFCNSPSDPSLSLPDPMMPPPVYYQHVYSIDKSMQSAWLKRYYVRYWLKVRWPHFKAHYSDNIRALESVVRICKERGLNPVLVDLPRDLPIIGRSFDSPVATYKAGCKRVATEYRIPWLTFVAAADLVNRDFFDIFHLVEPGRVKYQRLLSEKAARLLDKYGLKDPEPTPTPTPSPTETPAPSLSPTETSAP
jgi:hypothetical protein